MKGMAASVVSEVQTYGIEGIENDLLLKTLQIHRNDTDDTSDEFQRRIPVGAVLEITTTTELTLKLETPVDVPTLRTAVSGGRVN